MIAVPGAVQMDGAGGNNSYALLPRFTSLSSIIIIASWKQIQPRPAKSWDDWGSWDGVTEMCRLYHYLMGPAQTCQSKRAAPVRVRAARTLKLRDHEVDPDEHQEPEDRERENGWGGVTQGVSTLSIQSLISQLSRGDRHWLHEI